ncbi:hypothetical protein MK805_01065 [Shimazuella sp. AN120528]|uniref:hypothetical protein n=1 Tax=Shimazuella soli TaxID=1892854 RepID=UPI001F0FDC57|nr:hypothetical protein [Shimazuella soli]MCH5583561.1 hypothetical protein [Shimazuella soli]
MVNTITQMMLAGSKIRHRHGSGIDFDDFDGGGCAPSTTGVQWLDWLLFIVVFLFIACIAFFVLRAFFGGTRRTKPVAKKRPASRQVTKTSLDK